MKRLLVLLLMLALPIRTVLAVSGIGCAMPMQMPIEMPQHADGMPCAMHAAAGSTAATPADTASTACSSCAAACCAALAPMPTAIAGGFLLAGDDVAAVIETSFANASLHSLERPPRLA